MRFQTLLTTVLTVVGIATAHDGPEHIGPYDTYPIAGSTNSLITISGSSITTVIPIPIVTGPGFPSPGFPIPISSWSGVWSSAIASVSHYTTAVSVDNSSATLVSSLIGHSHKTTSAFASASVSVTGTATTAATGSTPTGVGTSAEVETSTSSRKTTATSTATATQTAATTSDTPGAAGVVGAPGMLLFLTKVSENQKLNLSRPIQLLRHGHFWCGGLVGLRIEKGENHGSDV
ncbi:hypothetical protein B0O99DRAFT_288062 [Bisporella sp. PMI_857]|nr:hypothetical protein B0O99DRAFT_288062 [Bisporella sp. PMI_857]